MIKTFRYRIYPSKRQEQVLNQQLAICCELYNAGVRERREAWQRERKSISYFDQTKQLAEIKSLREDVCAINANVLENTLKRVQTAFEGFFRRVRNGEAPGYPRFRSARRYDSLTFRQIGQAVKGSKLRLSRIGWVRINLHRPIVGLIKTLTVKREAGRWFALFVIETETAPLPFSSNAIGVDVGLTSFATLSDGTSIENPRWFRGAQAKLRRLQRRVARRKKGSHRRLKAVLLLQRFHNHVRDQRRDFHHNLSRALVDANGLIAVEDLNVNGMAQHPKLGKSILDAGWTNFIRLLTYKAEDAGRLLVKVDPRGTSQICTCGSSVKKTLAQRWHLCLNCGLSADRDHVSAQVILSRAGVQPSGANVGELSPCVA